MQLIGFYARNITEIFINSREFVKIFAKSPKAYKTIVLPIAITLLKKLYNFIIYVKIMETK